MVTETSERGSGRAHRHFDLKKRIDVDLQKLPFRVLTDLFAAGDSYIEELDRLKAEQASRKAACEQASAVKRRKKGPTLRETQPW